ncbi:MAG: hypothetical protein R3E32_29755 [Chitinophagales bacterium]
MLKIYFFYILFLLMTVASCKKENLIIIEGVESISFDCLTSINEHQIINDSEAYKLFLDTYRNNSQNCLTYISPSIDFTEKTLLGQYIEVTACNVSSISEVFADPSQKRYIYQLQVNLEGTCETRFERLVWIVVPKLPDNYTVAFEANYERI